jgi:hypothetical protein
MSSGGGSKTSVGKNSTNDPGEAEQFDISFAYRYNWGYPEKQVREALKVLLFNSTAESQIKTEPKPQDKQKKIGVNEEAARIRWLLAINPNTPPPVLDHLIKYGHGPLLERIADNPRTHATTLIKLSSHNESQVRASLAENNNISMKTMWRLARDPSPDVRFRLAESYTVPLAVLRVLSEDENPYVSYRAQKTIRRMVDEINSLRSA